MIRIENDCVGCPKEMGCLGSSCPYRDVPHYYCDECGEEISCLYALQSVWSGGISDEFYCEECILDYITTDIIDAFFEQDNLYEDENIKHFYSIAANSILANKESGQEKIVINSLDNEDEYKLVREYYRKYGDVNAGLEFIHDISYIPELLEFCCDIEDYS